MRSAKRSEKPAKKSRTRKRKASGTKSAKRESPVGRTDFLQKFELLEGGKQIALALKTKHCSSWLVYLNGRDEPQDEKCGTILVAVLV